MTVRLLLTAVNCPKGQVEANLQRHRELLTDGSDTGCDLVLMPEMSLTGYRPEAAIELGHPAVVDLVRRTKRAAALCFGLVEAGSVGEPPYITQVLACGGKMVAVHRKTGLGDGESGCFTAGTPAGRLLVGETPVSLAVCAEIGTEAPYAMGSTVVLGPSAPGLYGERRRSEADWQRGLDWWRASVTRDARHRLGPGQWLAVSTQAGATDDEDFPGWAALVGPGGSVTAELPDWREGVLVVDVPR